MRLKTHKIPVSVKPIIYNWLYIPLHRKLKGIFTGNFFIHIVDDVNEIEQFTQYTANIYHPTVNEKEQVTGLWMGDGNQETTVMFDTRWQLLKFVWDDKYEVWLHDQDPSVLMTLEEIREFKGDYPQEAFPEMK